MTQVTTKESYVYDGHGRRVQITKTADGSINYPLYSLDGKLILEDNRQTLQRIEYIFAGGRLVAKKIQPITAAGANNGTATTTTIHTDFLGSPVVETNSAGTVSRVERYTPYGEPSDMQLDAGPGFTGHATDVATGLTYMQQRYYDPDIIRFPVPDPVKTDANTGGNFNVYWYADNNPVKNVDPDGRSVANTDFPGYSYSPNGSTESLSNTKKESEQGGSNTAKYSNYQWLQPGKMSDIQRNIDQNLSDTADDNQHVNSAEAKAHFQYGNGKSLSVDQSKLSVTYYRFNGGYRAWVTGFDDYLVHGQVSINFKTMTIMNAPYNFEYHKWSGPLNGIRNIQNFFVRMYVGVGKDFEIIYTGSSPRITEIPQPVDLKQKPGDIP